MSPSQDVSPHLSLFIDVYLYIYVHYIAYAFKDALSSKHFMKKKTMSLFWLVMPSHDSMFLKMSWLTTQDDTTYEALSRIVVL
jgi:hypothetical protein